jgi:hypothetical protein
MQRVLFAALALVWALASQAAAPDASVRDSLFKTADQGLLTANDARAEVLSPTNYRRGVTYCRDAEKSFAKNGNLDGIRGDLDEAIAAFSTAVESAKLAEFTLTTAIQARQESGRQGRGGVSRSGAQIHQGELSRRNPHIARTGRA